MARLYDPTEGSVFLDGRDIRSVPPDDRSRKVGFIPQEPFLFTGTVRENIIYGNDEYQDYSSSQLAEVLDQARLSELARAILRRAGDQGCEQRKHHQPGAETAHRLHARDPTKAGTTDSG